MNKLDEAQEVYDMYHMVEKGHNSYQICVTLDDEQVNMEVHTGAARSIMSYNSFCKLKKTSRKMKSTDVILRSYGGDQLKVRGKVQIPVSFQSRQNPRPHEQVCRSVLREAQHLQV